MTDTDQLARGLYAALCANEPFLPPSADAELDMTQALAVQQAFNRLRAAADPIAGFKAALNAPDPQRALGLAEPIVGALFASGARAPGARVDRSAYRNLLIETELGFRAARRIDAPIDDLDDVRAAMATVAPLFELADPGFGRVPIRGTDMVAANAACGGFVEGRRHALAACDVNAVRVVLRRDGETLHEAHGSDLLGDHWLAVRWLVNRVVAQGYVIEAGQLLLTGSLGGAHPAAPGVYTADFTDMGSLTLTVR
jgi:2-keto-4-pentenoate hydratase